VNQAVVRAAMCAVAAFVGVALAAQGTVSLSGQWRLNSSLSDIDAGSSDGTMSGPQGGRAPMGGGFGGLGGPSMGGGMRGGPPEDPERMKQRRELLRELLEPAIRFVIEQDAEAVTFTYADGRRVTYRTNGKAEKHQAINGTVETETRWSRGALVRETNLDDGLTIAETFTREEGGLLTITVRMSGGPMRRAKPLRRVYELETPAGAGEEQDPA
jgi:hypothetical protein